MKIEKYLVGYRRLVRYLRYYDASRLAKLIVISLMIESKFFNMFYYYRTRIRGYFINRVYKKHGDHDFTR